MSNEDILAATATLTTDATVMAWTSKRNGRIIEIVFLACGERLFQLRDRLGPNVEALPFAHSLEGLAAARREARDRAEINEL